MAYYIKRKKKTQQRASEGAKKARKPDLVKKLDKVFALYIRLRDVMPNGYGRCISCGRIRHFSDLDCGHFYSRKHMGTRFDEDNCSAECKACNRFSADHLINYQTNLIRKIGMARFELLGVKAKRARKWDDFELEELIKHYTAEVRRLSADRGINVSL